MPDTVAEAITQMQEETDPRAEPRYWVYIHDEQDELVESIGYYDSFKVAMLQAAEEIKGLALSGETACTIRIVDNEDDGGTTVWMAGPKPTNAVPV